MIGNYMLTIFYTTVGGWMVSYTVKMIKGDFVALNTDDISSKFLKMLANPTEQILFMIIVVLMSFFICSFGIGAIAIVIVKKSILCQELKKGDYSQSNSYYYFMIVLVIFIQGYWSKFVK